MPYLALYRKLRPKVFSDVIGQEHIIRILKNQLETNTVSHAYLFCGTRGTGKTSTAKIFAKALNCKARTGDGPCGICESCQAVQENRSLNVIEIDAASNNGVDNIREIREEVKYPPTDGGIKVYIIDEVHMLSAGAFNALLKTLEEPPSHVVFILATTDPERIPATVLSRCQRLDFKRISVTDIASSIKEHMSSENMPITEDAALYIAGIADGAMRDAQSLLDQCIAYYYGEEITLEKVMAVTGAVDNTVFFNLAEALVNFDNVRCLKIIEEAVNLGKDIGRFISDFIYHLRNTLIVSAGGGAVSGISEQMSEKYKAHSAVIGGQRLISYINEFSLLSGSLRYAFNERIVLETLCIKLCNPETVEADFSGIISRLEKLESAPAVIIKEQTILEPAQVKEINTPAKVRKKSTPDDINTVIKDWHNFVSKLDMPTANIFRNTIAGYLDGNNLVIVFGDMHVMTHAKNREEEIKKLLLDIYEKEFALSFMLREDYNNKHESAYGQKDPAEALLREQISKKLNGVNIEVDNDFD